MPFGISRGLLVETDLRGPAYLPLGLYEYETHRWVRRFARPGVRAFDIGAASGVHALALARMTRTTVIAFEADPASLVSLEAHCTANPGPARRVVVEPRYVGRQTCGTYVALDDFCTATTYPGFLKIDVEGAELDVLMGAEALLRVRRPHLLIETHDAAIERDVGDFLVAVGYSPVVISQRRRLREDRPALHNRWLAADGGSI